jgi:hypothetical protein
LSSGYDDGTLDVKGAGAESLSLDLDPSTVALNSTILSQLAGTTVTSGANTEITIGFTETSGTFSGEVANSDVLVTTTAGTVAAAEPPTIGLLGAALLPLFVFAAFRRKEWQS